MSKNTLRWMIGCAISASLVASGCATAESLPDQPCESGDTLVRRCGVCGTTTAACVNGAFADFETCNEPASCNAPDGGSGGQSAGSGGVGGQSAGGGGAGGRGAAGESCLDGDTYTQRCGNCGTRQRTCVSGIFGAWSVCAGEGECAAGSVTTEACGGDVGACTAGERSRTCSASCTWSGWGTCGGSYVGPRPETCDDGQDENCNGVVDEGCACHPVEVGAGGSFVLSGSIAKIIADPSHCFLYALNIGTPSQVVVIDTSSKRELTRVALPFAATDIDISPDGSKLVVAHDAAHSVSLIDKSLWTVASTVSTLSDPYKLEVTNTGVVYYVELDQWVDIRRIDLVAGSLSDTVLASWGMYQGDIELSSNGLFLYGGESGISGGDLQKYNISGGGFTSVDDSTWDDGYGFPYPGRHVYLSPNGAHVYYAGYQLDGNALSTVRGQTGERVFAEDADETFAIGETHVFDAALMRPVASLPHAASAAALTAADQELWVYSAGTGRTYYQNINDLLAGTVLGARDFDPAPIAAYSISKLVHDPMRPVLYGLDTARQSVVFFDASTLLPTHETLVGSTPTDIAIDAEGVHLFVGHLDTLAVARLDLASRAFDAFLPTARVPYDVETLSGGWLATIDEDQWTRVTLLNGVTGAESATPASFIYQGVLTATADGNTLFVGESSLSGSNISRYSFASGMLTAVDHSDYDSGYGFPYPPRSAKALPDGSGVYYASYLLDGADLSILRYPAPDAIVSVTPDGRLAISQSAIYHVENGARAGTLPSPSLAQTVSPDSATLYTWTGAGLLAVDLSAY